MWEPLPESRSDGAAQLQSTKQSSVHVPITPVERHVLKPQAGPCSLQGLPQESAPGNTDAPPNAGGRHSGPAPAFPREAWPLLHPNSNKCLQGSTPVLQMLR